MTEERVLDRIEHFDPRSLDYPVSAVLPTNQPRTKTWGCDIFNDQGWEGACVGYAWSHDLSAQPYIVRTYAEGARKIYNRAKQLDAFPGEAYSGTSVLAGAKAVQEMKGLRNRPLLQTYRWGFSVEDVVASIGYIGPVVLGTPWWTNMFNPNSEGLLKPTGSIAGGHAILIRGFKYVGATGTPSWARMDRNKSTVLLHNSWGTDWGIRGTAQVTVADLDNLLHTGGEACIPTIRNYG